MASYAAYLERQRKQKERLFFIRLLAIVGSIILLAVAARLYLRQSQEFARLEQTHEKLELAYRQACQQAQELSELKARMGSNEFIERIARDELGLVRSDEIVFGD